MVICVLHAQGSFRKIFDKRPATSGKECSHGGARELAGLHAQVRMGSRAVADYSDTKENTSQKKHLHNLLASTLLLLCVSAELAPKIQEDTRPLWKGITASKPGNLLQNLDLKSLWGFGGKLHLWYSLLNLSNYRSDTGINLFLGQLMDMPNFEMD